MFVLLKKAFQGQAVGAKIDVSDDDAKSLVDAGIAEHVKGDPLAELAEKALEGAMGNLAAGLEKAVEKQLKAFSQAMTRSRKNATPLIFGEDGDGDVKGRTFGDWLLAIRRKDLKRLEEYGSHFVDWDVGVGDQKAALNTQTGTQGGFTTPVDFLPRLMQLASENAVVRPRATVIPMGSKSIQVPALDHATAPAAGDTAFIGGLKATWTEEAVAQTETEPVFKQIDVIAYELSGYSKISNALMADNAVGLDALLMQLFGRAIGWYEDYAFLRGSGAGKPLGAITWPGFVQVTRSGGSAFVLSDFAGVLARWLQNYDGAASCWVCHPTVLVKLFQLSSTLGQLIFIDNVRDKPRMMLAGLPLVVSEKVPALGTAGDVGVYDWSKYIIGDRQQVEIAFSEHYAFITNQSVWRFVSRVGGKPWMSDKVTLSDATNSLSPFVGLAA